MESFFRGLVEPARKKAEHRFEHRDSKLAGVGIKPGSMVAVGKKHALGQPVQGAVREGEEPATQA